MRRLSAFSTVNGWEGSDGLCAGCGLCAREPLSRRSPGGLSQDFFGLRIEREELVLRPCSGCFLSYKERIEGDKLLYLVKKMSGPRSFLFGVGLPDLLICTSSPPTHSTPFPTHTSSDPYFVTLCHVRHSALIHALPLSSTEINPSSEQLIATGCAFVVLAYPTSKGRELLRGGGSAP